MRKNPQVAAGWSLIVDLDAFTTCATNDGMCRTSISWRTGITEIQVFGINAGEAAPVGNDPVFTYH